MPRIVLTELDTESTFNGLDNEAIIGRDPTCAFVVEGAKSKVVSGRHARLFVQDNSWWVEDWSRNGTIVDHERLQRGVRHALREGQVIGLGDTGPRYRIMLLDTRHIAATVVERAPAHAPATNSTAPQTAAAPRAEASAPAQPSALAEASAAVAEAGTMAMRRSEAIRAGVLAASEGSTEPMSPSPDWIVHVILRDTHTNHRYDVRDPTVKVGRAPVCLVQIPPEQGAAVSRVHSEFAIEGGGIVVRDAGSRNGTYVNGKRIDAPVNCVKGDLVMLGVAGPTLAIEELHIIKAEDLPEHMRPTPIESAERASSGETTPAHGNRLGNAVQPVANAVRRSMENLARTPLLKDVVQDMSQETARRTRIVIWGALGTIVTVGAAMLGVLSGR
jgi:pSer/pThr/pTyr-binding forkhead associated (FHA) protein